MKKNLFATIIVGAIVLAGCNSGAAGDPKAVLSQFFEALSKKDMAAASKLATADSKGMLDMMSMALKTETKETMKYDKANMEFGEAKIDGDKATVPVKEMKSGETLNYVLKNEGGSWKVAFDMASLMNMATEKMNEKGMNMPDSLNMMMDKLKEVNLDSLSRALKEGGNALDSAAKMLEQLKK